MMDKQDIYTRVTNKIVAQLESGVKPWEYPWQSGHAIQRPLRACGVPYQGINVFMLWAEAIEKGYRSRYWTTYKQAQELGGNVKKGEKSTLVVYASKFIKTEQNAKGEDVDRAIPFLKGYCVFNAEQCEDLPAHMYAERAEPVGPIVLHDACSAFFDKCRSIIRHGGGRAFYCPSSDHVQMPDVASFKSTEGYYSVLSHEHIHWTSHKSRLDRELGKRFGDKQYAVEELIAELGAAFLCADLGLSPEPREDHASYIATWLKILKDDKRAIFTAASHAQKAADYLNGLQAPIALAA